MKALRDFLKTQLTALDPDFKEWKDGFNRDNIPSSLLNKSYHIQTTSISPTLAENKLVYSTATVKLEIFYKGYLNPAETLDAAMKTGYDLTLKIVNPCNWTNIVKYVSVTSIIPEPIESNDNSLLINIQFSFNLISVTT